MNRAYYSDTIASFLELSIDAIKGKIIDNSEFADELTQKGAWNEEIQLLKQVLEPYDGAIYFEFAIPRMGRRIDVLLIIESVIFVLEFKVGEKGYPSYAIDQVMDYALDLKNFHETSHDKIIVPILISTGASSVEAIFAFTAHNDDIAFPMCCNALTLGVTLKQVLSFVHNENLISIRDWEEGRYKPTPTIIEAAMALYNNHSVVDISRSDASAINLSTTSGAISKIIQQSKDNSEKAICFVTGVPGAGKTLVGLDIATKHFDKESELYSVFLSGNGPLVATLQEALARDKVARAIGKGIKMKKGEARSKVKAFIQIVHHFRDDGLRDGKAPIEHVALFDEAQRA